MDQILELRIKAKKFILKKLNTRKCLNNIC